MFIRKTVRDLMIPLDKYSVVGPEDTLKEAVSSLRTSYCEMETGMCTEAGPRTIFVVDKNGVLLGILDFRTILKVLIPEVTGGLTARLEAMGVSMAMAQADLSPEEMREHFNTRVIRNAGVRVKDIMLQTKANIQADADLTDALKQIFRKNIIILPVYEGDRLIGVIRDVDLFLAVADILAASPSA